MARVVITPSADAATDFILSDLASVAGKRVAAKYDNLLNRLYDRLAAHLAIGAPRPGIGLNIRIGIVSPYIVIYRYASDSDTVIVLRIVHGRRRITKDLLSEDRS